MDTRWLSSTRVESPPSQFNRETKRVSISNICNARHLQLWVVEFKYWLRISTTSNWKSKLKIIHCDCSRQHYLGSQRSPNNRFLGSEHEQGWQDSQCRSILSRTCLDNNTTILSKPHSKHQPTHRPITWKKARLGAVQPKVLLFGACYFYCTFCTLNQANGKLNFVPSLG